jgi:serine/threonine-protein kinase RsbW
VSESSPRTGTASAAATSPRTRTRSFRATTDQVREARRFLAQLLGDCPLAVDAVACLSELATNSVLHSNSRRPGGCFTVRASLRPAGLRVEVEDEGGPWGRRREPDDQCGRGFVIVGALSSDWSITGNETTRTAWFEMHQPPKHTSAAKLPPTFPGFGP